MANPASKAVKFVESGPTGLPVKRKQVQQACEACRKRKKRCIHTEGAAATAGNEEDVDDFRSPSSNGSSQGRDRRGQRRSLPDGLPTKQSSATPPSHATRRFICDTNPEGMFSEAVNKSAEPLSVSAPPPPPAHATRHFVAAPTHPAGRFIGDTSPEGLFNEGLNSSQKNGTRQTSSSYKERRFVCDTNPEGLFTEVTGPQDLGSSSRNDEVGVWVSSRPHGVTTAQQAPNATATRPSIPFDPILIPYVKLHCLPCLPPEKDFRALKKVYFRKIHPIYNLIPVSVLGDDLESPANVVLRQAVSLAAASDPAVANNLRLSNKGPAKMSFTEFTQTLSDAIRTTLATSLIGDRTIHIRVLSVLAVYFQPSSLEESEVPAQFFAEAVHHCQTLGLHLLRTGEPAMETLFCAVWAIDKINAAANGRPRLLWEVDFAASIDECISHQEPCFRLFLMISRWLDKTIDLYRPAVSADAFGPNKPFVELPVLEPMIVEAGALEVPGFLIATIEVFYHAIIILSCRLPRPGTEPEYSSNIPPPMASARRSLASERIAANVKKEQLAPVPFVPYAVSLALSVEYRKMRFSMLPMFRARGVEDFKSNCELLKHYKDTFWNARVTYGLGERLLKEMERAATSSRVQEAPPAAPARAATDLSSEPTPEMAARQPAQPQESHNGFDVSVNGLPNLDMVDFNFDVFGHFDPSFDLNMADNALEGNLDIGLPLNWGEWEQTGAGVV